MRDEHIYSKFRWMLPRSKYDDSFLMSFATTILLIWGYSSNSPMVESVDRKQTIWYETNETSVSYVRDCIILWMLYYLLLPAALWVTHRTILYMFYANWWVRELDINKSCVFYSLLSLCSNTIILHLSWKYNSAKYQWLLESIV